MKKGFTLIELLAVIVILAIIALIATPIVLSIISDSKESSGLRSAEMYLDAVEHAISLEKMNNTNFNPNSCTITNEGNLYCDEDESNIIEVEVNGETPINGNIIFEEGKITDISLVYNNDKVIVKDEDGNLVYGESGRDSKELDLSTVNTDLTTNSWEDVQKVIAAGKAEEAGWKVGDTKTLTISSDDECLGDYKTGGTRTATIIALNHDGENTATFMITSFMGIGIHNMNSNGSNDGGWEASEMRAWLNGDIYNSMTDTKDYIKEVTKMTNNTGYQGTEATETKDKVFLLSVVEVGLSSDFDVDGEGTTYDWFKNNIIDDSFWTRSAIVSNNGDFGFHTCVRGAVEENFSDGWIVVCPAFVIG